MCFEEQLQWLQRWMNYRIKNSYSIFLMSTRAWSPYWDEVLNEWEEIIYEWHDVPRSKDFPDTKNLDQKLFHKTWMTQNWLFFSAAQEYKDWKRKPEVIKVYEKIKSWIWVYNWYFSLLDARDDKSDWRTVYKFKLKIIDWIMEDEIEKKELDHNRMIPSHVKLEVRKRDKWKCITCWEEKNLHFDHIIPYSKWWSSLLGENIQLLCAKHNLQKSDKII